MTHNPPQIAPVKTAPLGVSESEAKAQAREFHTHTGLNCMVWRLTDGTFAASRFKPPHAVVNVGAFLQGCGHYYEA